MQWQGRRSSDNVDDRRGSGGGLPVGRLAGGGIGIVLIAVVVMMMGGDPSQILGGLTGDDSGVVASSTNDASPRSAEENTQAEFTKVVLASTEDVWNEIMPRLGATYREPRMELFTGRVQSACGMQSAAVGPFYCPGDSKVYVDLSFFAELDRELGAPGDFAQAYVIAHEVGHHVQNLLGTSRAVHDQQARVGEAAANDLSVRLELQADFYAGVWAHHEQRFGFLDPGDLDEALRAAGRIGDDVLQKRARGYATPDSFTHGTAEQRMRWFKKGLDSGDPTQGDTFRASKL